MIRRVLALCAQSKRDMIKKALQNDFKVSFISALSETYDAINSFKPELFLHDSQAQDETQLRQFHFKFGQSTTAIDLVRIILVAEVTPQMMAFASDALIERLHSFNAISLSLVTEAKMLLDGRESNEMQKFLRESKQSSFQYSQEKIDSKVEQLYNKFGHDPKVKLEYGNLLLRQGHHEKVVPIAQDLINKDPNNLRANNLMARVKMKLGYFEEALELLNRGNILSPSNPSRLVMLGDAFFGKGDLDRALEHYEQAINLDGDTLVEAGRQVGRIKLARGELAEAVTFFKSCVSEEESAGFFNNAAVQAARAQQFEGALKLYESALQTLKTDRLKPVIYFNIALSHVRLSQNDEAIKALNRALSFDPKHEKSISLLQKVKPSRAS